MDAAFGDIAIRFWMAVEINLFPAEAMLIDDDLMCLLINGKPMFFPLKQATEIRKLKVYLAAIRHEWSRASIHLCVLAGLMIYRRHRDRR